MLPHHGVEKYFIHMTITENDTSSKHFVECWSHLNMCIFVVRQFEDVFVSYCLLCERFSWWKLIDAFAVSGLIIKDSDKCMLLASSVRQSLLRRVLCTPMATRVILLRKCIDSIAVSGLLNRASDGCIFLFRKVDIVWWFVDYVYTFLFALFPWPIDEFLDLDIEAFVVSGLINRASAGCILYFGYFATVCWAVNYGYTLLYARLLWSKSWKLAFSALIIKASGMLISNIYCVS